MADCIPNTINSLDFATLGEQKVFNTLKKLPDTCIVWYEMVLSERNFRPDFMILDPERGLCIIEVKDWSIDAIKQASTEHFTVQWHNNVPDKRMNPQLKCQIYLSSARERLTLCKTLRDEQYRLQVPVTYVIAFPNMSLDEFDSINLGAVINADHVLFREHIANLGRLSDRLDTFLPVLEHRLTNEQISHIRLELRGENTVTLTGKIDSEGRPTSGTVIQDSDVTTIFSIDEEQEKVAKNLGEGPRLLRGMAGSGKTLILLMRAKLSTSNAQEMGKRQRILILCWNISLANYMRQAFDAINIPFDGKVTDKAAPSWYERSTVEIVHFMGWTRDVFQKYSSHKMPKVKSPDFMDQVTERLSQVILPESAKYDAIYIDEAQDFREEWLSYLFNYAMKEQEPVQRNLIVSADDAQRIYRHQGRNDFSWAGLNIPMQGRSKIFRRIYRNSARVWMFAGFFLGNIGGYYLEEDGSPSAKLSFARKQGRDPELIGCVDVRSQIREVVNAVQDAVTEGYSPGNVLVLYHSASNGKVHIVNQLQRAFDRANIKYDWIAENPDAKSSFDWTEDSVKISTVHSAKGLDAPIVIVMEAESFVDSDDVDIDETKLMYVALTRAREYLKVLYTGDGGMVEALKKAARMYEQYRPRVLMFEENGHHQHE